MDSYLPLGDEKDADVDFWCGCGQKVQMWAESVGAGVFFLVSMGMLLAVFIQYNVLLQIKTLITVLLQKNKNKLVQLKSLFERNNEFSPYKICALSGTLISKHYLLFMLIFKQDFKILDHLNI